jgi:hypothetical protein
MKSDFRIIKWHREIRYKKRSFSFMAINKIEHLIKKITKNTIWATKSFEVWLLIQNLLFLTKPLKILEFGSGRSTNYLSEYAYKNNSDFISLEHNFYFYLRVKLGLNFSFLNPEYVKYVPLKDKWYNTAILEKLLKDYKNIDFFYIDGPSNSFFEDRDPQIFYDYILPKLNVKIILIDDTHWENGAIMAEKLSQILNLTRYDVEYKAGITDNKLSLLFDKRSIIQIEKLPDYLKDMLIKF